ncbi:MAG TPA: histidine ammonia-lyase [Bacteriovoracaceae bacterium]|nr:histidine ammonia-lyase [Bacteriovoracaceae bacterium]
MIDFTHAKIFELTGTNLSIDDMAFISKAKPGQVQLKIHPTYWDRMKKSRQLILDIVKKGKPVYGINTGFGALASKQIADADLEKLQYNLIRSHCTGVGDPFSRELTRAIMLARANCLIQGFSGVTPEIIALLLEFINHGIHPVIPQKGSVGASGDLAPLSHVALSLIGEGEVEFQGKTLSADFVMHQLALNPARLGPKDGLALINGTSVMLALGCLALVEAKKVVKLADIISCLTLDAVRGTATAFDPRISRLKPQPGQVDVSSNLNKIISGSEIVFSHQDDGKVQDPYSLRCIPQVHGACRQTLRHAEEVLDIELNSVTDNPLVFVDTGDVVSGGNFHGEALALCMDYMAMGLAEICSIAERRVEKMMNPHFSDLPAFLTRNSGLNSGLMIAHVTLAALASENKYLCHPASVDSIPTSTDKEDHVSMGVTAGRKLHEVLNNVQYGLAIELLCNTQGIEFLRPLKTSPALEKIITLVRKHVPFIEEDRTFHKDIEHLARLIKSDELIKEVESVTGRLA